MSEERVLIDILSDDSYEKEHLPGSKNFCVYEAAFASKVTEAFPDRKTPLTICGFCDDTKEVEIAVEKLRAEGYEDISIIDGGLRGWKESGNPTQGSGVAFIPEDGKREVDSENSFIRWTGRNLFNFHTGDLKLSGGFAELKNGELASAEFRIDMNSIACSDLTDSKFNRMLIDHLRTDDFFDVEHFPEAKFVVGSAVLIPDVSAGLPNYRIKGELNLRGKSYAVEFDALVAWKEDGSCVAQAVLDFDRTKWGSIYGSGKFFSRLGQHVVNDLVHLHVKVVTLPI